MNIKARLYCLTALNIVILSGVGLVGYIGIERLHPQNTTTSNLRQAIHTFDSFRATGDALKIDLLSIVANTKANNPSLGSSEALRTAVTHHSQLLLEDISKLESAELPLHIKRTITNNRLAAEQVASATKSLTEQLDRNPDEAKPQLTFFLNTIEKLQKNSAAAKEEVHAAWETERAKNIVFGHSIQNTVVTTLLLGIACAIILVLITLRSILRPIEAISNALGLSAAEVDISAQKMSLCAEDLAQSATEQAAAVQESVASMTEMSSMIAQTGDSSTESLTNVRRMAERTEDGNRIMERLASSTEAINQANVQLREMVDIIGEISSKTSVMNDIVFKTQLLSFNASIEAARAGQHGRGFAVVAEEFGSLAELSGQAAKEIQSLLETSKKHVSELVDMTNQRVSDGQAVSKEALIIFNEISKETNHITRQIQRISEATREQQIGVQQTSTAMNQMDQAAQRNSHLAGDTLRSASELSQQSRKLTSIMQGLLSLINSGPGERHHSGGETHGTSPRGLSHHTHVLELNDRNLPLDQAFLNEASNKLSSRVKSNGKSDVDADDEEFQPYQGR